MFWDFSCMLPMRSKTHASASLTWYRLSSLPAKKKPQNGHKVIQGHGFYDRVCVLQEVYERCDADKRNTLYVDSNWTKHVETHNFTAYLLCFELKMIDVWTWVCDVSVAVIATIARDGQCQMRRRTLTAPNVTNSNCCYCCWLFG